MMTPEGPRCQSCGMPLTRDAEAGGTEADGSRSADYCSHCYQKGSFTDTKMTSDRMVARVRERLLQMKLPPGMVEKLAAEIPMLKRWAR